MESQRRRGVAKDTQEGKGVHIKQGFSKGVATGGGPEGVLGEVGELKM